MHIQIYTAPLLCTMSFSGLDVTLLLMAACSSLPSPSSFSQAVVFWSSHMQLQRGCQRLFVWLPVMHTLASWRLNDSPQPSFLPTHPPSRPRAGHRSRFSFLCVIYPKCSCRYCCTEVWEICSQIHCVNRSIFPVLPQSCFNTTFFLK